MPGDTSSDLSRTWNRSQIRGVALGGAAVVWLIAYAFPILNPGLPPAARRACAALSVAVWLVFTLDYLWRLQRAPRRLTFLREHPVDLLLIVLPALRPLRLLRLITVLRVLNVNGGGSFRGRVSIYVGSATLVVGFCAALAVLDAERGTPGANITTFGDACWWAMTTITTVGYGDRYPVTGAGRLVAVGLMLAGIALLGLVTASLASWLIERVGEGQAESAAATRADVAALAREVQGLREELQARRTEDQDAPGQSLR